MRERKISEESEKKECDAEEEELISRSSKSSQKSKISENEEKDLNTSLEESNAITSHEEDTEKVISQATDKKQTDCGKIVSVTPQPVANQPHFVEKSNSKTVKPFNFNQANNGQDPNKLSVFPSPEINKATVLHKQQRKKFDVIQLFSNGKNRASRRASLRKSPIPSFGKKDG